LQPTVPRDRPFAAPVASRAITVTGRATKFVIATIGQMAVFDEVSLMGRLFPAR
jgi:hypothetical protein